MNELPTTVVMTPSMSWTEFELMEKKNPGCHLVLDLVPSYDGGLEPSGRPGTNLIPDRLLKK